jgi:hypothetical protein
MVADVGEVACRNCGNTVSLARCTRCGRDFALTVAHVENRPREFNDGPAADIPAVELCDYCAAQDRGEPPTDVVNAGLRQKTCPVCHTDALV